VTLPAILDDDDFVVFTPEPGGGAAQIKCAVLKGGVLKLTLNAAALARLSAPETVEAACAVRPEGRFVRLTPGRENGWPVRRCLPPKGGRGGAAKRASAAVKLTNHPFTPGVVRRAEPCVAHWGVDWVVVTLPDWDAMLAAIEAG